MLTTDERLLHFVGRIYDAAVDAELWPVFLADLADYFSGTAAISSQAGLGTATSINSQVGIDRTFGSSYERYYSQKRPWAKLVGVSKLGEVLHPKQLIGQTEFERCEYVNDWLNPQDLHHLFSIRLRQDGQFSTFLTISRSRRVGDFSELELRLSRQLVPHLQRALQVRHYLQSVTEQRDALVRSLGSLEMAAMFVTTDGIIQFANSVAEDIFRNNRGLLVRNGCLQAKTPSGTSALYRLIGKAAGTSGGLDQQVAGVIALSSHEGDLHVLVCPVSAATTERLGSPCRAALVLASHSTKDLVLPANDLMALYRLTRAEAKLASALCHGTTLNDYAQNADISLATAKTQLQSIFGKMGCHRQSDVTRAILANGVARIASTLPSAKDDSVI